MNEEKRTFHRIATRIKGYARIMPSEEEQPLFREAPVSGPGAAGFEARDPSVPESLYALLATINAKLDMILSVQGRDLLTADFPLTLDVTEISGAGVRFAARDGLAVGDTIEVVLVLCQFPLRLAGAVGQVLRAEAAGGENAMALDFTRIRERDLESIVQFVFQSQRDTIRVNRWS